MIEFISLTPFELEEQGQLQDWISHVISSENFEMGEIQYIFCDDAYLHKINLEFLNHDTYTDIISFDYGIGKQINGEIYISVERVKENSLEFATHFLDELHRVMIHGILHFCGYKDETENEEQEMRLKEDAALSILKA